MSRKILVVFVACSLFLAASPLPVFAKGSDSSKVNQVLQDLYLGKVSPEGIAILESAFKQTPKNADLAAWLGAAHGLLASANNDAGQGNLAIRYAKQALALNPNSHAAQLTSFATKAHSANRADRDAAIAGLKNLTGVPETAGVRNFLVGKAFALNGNRAEAIKAFDASGLSLAIQAKSKLKVQSVAPPPPHQIAPVQRQVQ